MSSRSFVSTCIGNHMGSKCECQDSLVTLKGEIQTVDVDSCSFRTMGEALLRLADSGARRPDCSSKSTASTLTKSISDSLKIRKKRKSYVQSDLLQRNATCEGGDFNELNKPVSCFSHSLFGRTSRHASSIVSQRRSSSHVVFGEDSTRTVDMDTRGVLHTTDLTGDDDGIPLKHRRMSLTVGSTSELHPDEFEDSRQHSSMWESPLDVSQGNEINQPGLYKRSCSQSYFHSSKMTSVLPCAAPASQHKTAFAASKQFLNQTVDLHDLSLRRSSMSSRHRKSHIVDMYIQHRRRRQDSSSYHSQTFDLPYHGNDKSFDLSSYNQTFDVSQCHIQQAFDLSKQSHNQTVDSTQCSYRRCKSSEWTYELSSCDMTVPTSCDSFNVTVNTLNQTTDSACVSDYISANMTLPVGENGGNTAAHKMMTACSVHNIAAANPQSQENVAKAGRVASWAVQFDKLLHDPLAVKVFTEFLEKEFSAENIRFWQACEQFRSVTNEQQRKALAKDIYSRHLATRASEPVNVDGTARAYTERFVDTPTAIMFDVPQNQILQLMRQDSYPRFLKSDLYKNMLVEELEGNIRHEPEQTDNKGDKKQNSGKENNGKKRRSILPWKSLKSVKGTSEGEQKKMSKKGREGSNNQVGVPSQGSTSAAITTGSNKNNNNPNNNNMANIKKYTGLNIDLSIMRKEVFQQEEVVGGRETQVKFCRVILPDGSTTVVCAKPGQTCRSVLSKLCEKRSISISNVDVFLLGSDKSVDLNEDVSTLGSKEIVIERRVLFRLDLPDGKSVGAKAKPNRSIRDVLKPILSKYGYNLENINMNVTSCPEVINMEMQVTKLDNQRLVLTLEPETTGLQKHKGPLFGLFRASEKRVVERKHQGQGDLYKD